MELSDVFQSETLRASDLGGKEPTVTIETVKPKEFEDGNKLVITFVGAKKALVCNKTNANRIAMAHGTTFTNWPGKKIQLYTDLVDFQGKTVEAIRVRPVKTDGLKPNPNITTGNRQSENPADPSDDIPF